MAFKIDVTDDAVVEWHRTADGGVRTERVTDYWPSVFVAGDAGAATAPASPASGGMTAPESPASGGATAERGPMADLRAALDADPKVARTAVVERFARLDADERVPVLRVDLARPSEVDQLAREIRGLHERGTYPPGTFRLYDVDFSPGFRYCVETDTDPTIPEAVDLRTLELRVGRKRLADRDLSKLEIDGESFRATPDVLLEILENRLSEVDPDVLVVNRGELIALLYEKAADCGREEFELGRTREGAFSFRKLAGESTFHSYGRVSHSPARYDLPGRVLIDTSNSFLWDSAGLAGLRYLSGKSWRPIQEVARASIGTILTSIQIREARERDVLVPWTKWRPEAFKDVRTLHAADRGGFTFSPEVGLHEDVREVDFASLYPRIICEYNVSPDTVLCDCHADRADVPELGYNVCDDRGFLADVLEPLLDDRAALKEKIRTGTDSDGSDDEIARARQISNAIKWILVSCFGYQGYRNAKFGRIECHEAINAVARDLLLTAKERFEDEGWRVVHGIVDSLWVTPADDDPAPLDSLVSAVSDEVDIPLEREATYDWLCFVPRRDSDAGALNRYFGKVAGRSKYKLRGIEARQRSTSAFVERVQRDLLDALDRHREPAPVCDVLKRHLRDLRAGDVDPEELLITRRASKSREAYSHSTRTVAVVERAANVGLDPQPGQSFDFLVIDDDASRTRERVRLDFELAGSEGYDAAFYADRLLRAAESVLAPLGWDDSRIRRYLRDVEEVRLSAFGGG
ncbi:type B DNA-directed DNA polymerase [Halorussus litoreus]|uniref:type B DNA-directed DNA polymerase n=1 Tax=Halorussus litoreus TaxID=1710536 RepID=UPI000E23CBC5|nr:type B DNA-directed DNA polymerase [Halorussus litoreus]